jgi:hypothetical protein
LYLRRFRYRHESFREAFPPLAPAQRTPGEYLRNVRALRECGYDARAARALTPSELRVWTLHVEHDDRVSGVLPWSSRQWAEKLGVRLNKRALPDHLRIAIRGLVAKGLLRLLYVPPHAKAMVFVNSELYRYGGRITMRCVENRKEFRKALDASPKVFTPPGFQGASPPGFQGASPPGFQGAFLTCLTSVEVSDPFSPQPPPDAGETGDVPGPKALPRREELTAQASGSRPSPRADRNLDTAAPPPTPVGAALRTSPTRADRERAADKRGGVPRPASPPASAETGSRRGGARPDPDSERTAAARRWWAYRAALWRQAGQGQPAARPEPVELAPIVRALTRTTCTEVQLLWAAWADRASHTGSPAGGPITPVRAICRPDRVREGLALARNRGLDVALPPPWPPALADRPRAKPGPAPDRPAIDPRLNAEGGQQILRMLEGRSGGNPNEGVRSKRGQP